MLCTTHSGSWLGVGGDSGFGLGPRQNQGLCSESPALGFTGCSQKQLPAGRLFDLLRFFFPTWYAGSSARQHFANLWEDFQEFPQETSRRPGPGAALQQKNDRGEFGGVTSGIQGGAGVRWPCLHGFGQSAAPGKV